MHSPNGKQLSAKDDANVSQSTTAASSPGEGQQHIAGARENATDVQRKEEAVELDGEPVAMPQPCAMAMELAAIMEKGFGLVKE